jgi:CubicO group peptidase (beta-lactamase class C family)
MFGFDERRLTMTTFQGINRRDVLLWAGATLGAWVASPLARLGIAGAVEALDFSEIESRLRATIDEKIFEGVGLLLCTGDKTLYKRAFGADTIETVHLLASATKLASGTAVVTLVQDKLVTLDDPIRKYLPKFGPVRGAISIRQLLAQTHGMPAGHPSIPRPQQDNGMTLAECVDQIAEDDSVDFPPGSKQQYRPAVSYQIMGRIAEVATGEPWATLFEKRIARPLEMTTFDYGKTANPRIGGGAKCALQDYGNMLQMHLSGGVFNGRRVLPEELVAEMQKDQSYGAPFSQGRSGLRKQYGYGLTWWIDLLDERNQPVQFSVAGAFGAIPWLNSKAGYGGFLLVQNRLPAAWRLYTELFPILNDMKLS